MNEYKWFINSSLNINGFEFNAIIQSFTQIPSRLRNYKYQNICLGLDGKDVIIVGPHQKVEIVDWATINIIQPAKKPVRLMERRRSEWSDGSMAGISDISDDEIYFS